MDKREKAAEHLCATVTQILGVCVRFNVCMFRLAAKGCESRTNHVKDNAVIWYRW